MRPRKSFVTGCWRRLLFMAIGWLALSRLAGGEALLAHEASGQLGSVSYRILAPDRARQGEPMSVLLVLQGVKAGDAGAGETSRVEIRLDLPPGVFAEREGEAASGRRVEILVWPGEVRRFAFKGLEPRVDVERGVHELRLELRVAADGSSQSDGEATGREGPAARVTSVAFEVTTVRGTVVPRGLWSVVVPVLISLLALPVFVFMLRRFAEPSWWKRPGEPLPDEDHSTKGKAWWILEK